MSHPLQRRYCLDPPRVQSRIDHGRHYAMRCLQGHHVECFAVFRIIPNVRYPLADAHRRNTIVGLGRPPLSV
ncbi:hypothetical protein BVI2075_670010 [Burkholderia vietnamiensis]|nr:hypothetical protein BVI2075_670010 [Burkholderia vietnamiensis]